MFPSVFSNSCEYVLSPLVSPWNIILSVTVPWWGFRFHTFHTYLASKGCLLRVNYMLIQHRTLVCRRLTNVLLSAVAGWPERDLKSLRGSPSVCCVMEADVWPSGPADLLLCVHWCPNAQSQGPTHSSLVLHEGKKNIPNKSEDTMHSFNYYQCYWSWWIVLMNVLQITQWKCEVCTSVWIKS